MPRSASLAVTPAPRRGRPRKFITPSRPVTVTLPEPVLEALAALDGDLGRAIVPLAQPILGPPPPPHPGRPPPPPRRARHLRPPLGHRRQPDAHAREADGRRSAAPAR